MCELHTQHIQLCTSVNTTPKKRSLLYRTNKVLIAYANIYLVIDDGNIRAMSIRKNSYHSNTLIIIKDIRAHKILLTKARLLILDEFLHNASKIVLQQLQS